MKNPTHSSPPLGLPPGITDWTWLAQRAPGLGVGRATLDGNVVAVRVDAGGEELQARSELAALSAVDHPGLARLIDHGALKGGTGRYLVREWVDGEDLESWARGRAPEDVGRAIARLCPAVEHLHRRGFVHGDLKASNVIVRRGEDASGPVLTDFGLARARDATATEVSGTLFHLAPEVLLGAAISPAADLFALGVVLHRLFLGAGTSARDFYGRFPREDFFAATETQSDSLPEWARDIVCALVSRDPTRRPESADRLGRLLAGRLGLAANSEAEFERLSWPATWGRGDWTSRWMESLRESDEGEQPASPLRWVRLPDGEAPESMLEALALRAALSGAPVRRLDLALDLEPLATSSALDAWAVACARDHAGQLLFAAPRAGDPWQERGVEALARAVLQRARGEADERTPALIVAAGAVPAEPHPGWRVDAVPPIAVADVAAFLDEHLSATEDSPRRHSALAEVLLESSGGTPDGLDRALAWLAEQGWFLAGDERPRLRSGELPERLAPLPADEASPEVSADAGRLLCALHVHGSRATLTDLAGDVDGTEAAFAVARAELARSGAVVARRVGDATVLEATHSPGDAWARDLDEGTWQRWNRRRAERLEREGAGPTRSLPHRFAAGDTGVDQVIEAMRDLLEEGLPELALELAGGAMELARARGASIEATLRAERAMAWCALGQAARALEEVEPLAEALDSSVRGLVERVRGKVAALRHEKTRALEHLRAARALDSEDGGEALLGEAQLLFEVQRFADVEEIVEGLRGDEGRRAALAPRVWNNMLALDAMSAFRRGEVGLARERLQEQLAEAHAGTNRAREASLAINLATLERRSGDLHAALRYFDRAIGLYDHAGMLAGLAQARALSGGTLREAGRLGEAEPLLVSALAIRERLGDRVGAAAVRGMLGLLLADRGHAHSAVQELEHSASALRETGRSHDALLLDARVREMAARLSTAPAELPDSALAEATRVGEGDPRILISLARRAWLLGDVEGAAGFAARAGDLGARLGLVAIQVEAEFLVDAIGARFGAGPDERAESSLATQDRALCALLAVAPLDIPSTRALTDALESAGRDDRAARAWIALSVRSTDEEEARACRSRATELLSACSHGASASERRRLEDTLLGIPDPWPEDLSAWRRDDPDVDDQATEVMELLEINHRLLAQENLKSLLGTIVEQAIKVSGAQRGFLVLEESGELEVQTALDSRRGGIEESEVEFSGSALQRALETMESVRVSNAVDDPLLGGAPSVIALELRSILCTPFRSDASLRGVIYVDHRLREAAFDERAERVLRLLADQVALAIVQVRRLEEIRRLNRELGKQVVAAQSDLKTARKALTEANLSSTAGGLVGNARVMQDVRRLLQRAAASKLSVLITGESGTGKELAARALHELSPRASGPFVSESCAALPPSLIEAELFGARKGAFTGADRNREGLFERAHGGTLFLDEIGELPIDLQAKLLRVIESSEVRRLGGEQTRKVDFRLVVATNRDLEVETRSERFRADLYYRLAGIKVHMPPLSERTEDIPALVDHFLRLQEQEDGVRRTVSKEVLAHLMQRPWPGNVRELANEIARQCVLSEGDLVDLSLVSAPMSTDPGPFGSDGGVKTLAELERAAIERALSVTGGDKNEAARRLGISRAKIYQRLKEWSRAEAAD